LLELEFSDGRIIAYKGVSAKIHRQLMSSPSPASFVEDKIAENHAEARIRWLETRANKGFPADCHWTGQPLVAGKDRPHHVVDHCR